MSRLIEVDDKISISLPEFIVIYKRKCNAWEVKAVLPFVHRMSILLSQEQVHTTVLGRTEKDWSTILDEWREQELL